jgi:hypothetical protein
MTEELVTHLAYLNFFWFSRDHNFKYLSQYYWEDVTFGHRCVCTRIGLRFCHVIRDLGSVLLIVIPRLSSDLQFLFSNASIRHSDAMCPSLLQYWHFAISDLFFSSSFLCRLSVIGLLFKFPLLTNDCLTH